MAFKRQPCFEQNFKKPIDVCKREEEPEHIRVKFLIDMIEELCRERENKRSFKLNDKTKCYNLRDSTIPVVDEEDQFDFLYEGFDSPRARMSCGHVVTPMSLTKWCEELLRQGKTRFVCGQSGCNAEWPYQEVRRLAALIPDEMQRFEKCIANLAAAEYCDFKTCPGCSSYVEREDLTNLCVQCLVCTAYQKKQVQFCWQCLKPWKGPAPRSDRCDNDHCINNDLKLVSTCKTTSFVDVQKVEGCPSIRACPTCGYKLEHNRMGCKNVTCPRCQVMFCFVCLKLTPKCLETSSYYGPCSDGVAPRQTSIPVWHRN